MKYALDANIISFWMKGDLKVIENFDRVTKTKEIVKIPPFAYYEVKGGLLDKCAPTKLKLLNELVARYPVGTVDLEVIEEAARIYADLKSRGRTIDVMDIFIGAWCKVNDFVLITNNTKHFQHIAGLQIEDWSV